MSSKQDTISHETIKHETDSKKTCGIIMPISNVTGYPIGHWTDVMGILEEAINSAGFIPNIVSKSDEVQILQRNIVNNLYANEIIVCDVSSRNANVLFELGMRLTFDKPTVIIKDEKTIYPFDFGIIEYLEYPSDLKYQEIQKFKDILKDKITKTHEAGFKAGYSPFLKHFGPLKASQLLEKEGNLNELILRKLEVVENEINSIKLQQMPIRYYSSNDPLDIYNLNNNNRRVVGNFAVTDHIFPLNNNIQPTQGIQASYIAATQGIHGTQGVTAGVVTQDESKKDELKKD